MERRCCYGLCGSSSKAMDGPDMQGVYFIRFPMEKENPEKCKNWVKLCGRKDFKVESVTKCTWICSKHFKNKSGPTKTHPDPQPAVNDNEPLLSRYVDAYIAVEKKKRKYVNIRPITSRASDASLLKRYITLGGPKSNYLAPSADSIDSGAGNDSSRILKSSTLPCPNQLIGTPVIQVTPKLPLSTNNDGNESSRILKSSTAACPNLLICNPVIQVSPKLPLSTNNAGNESPRILKSSTAACPNLLICNPIVQATPKLPLSSNNANNAGNASPRILKSSTTACPNLLICNPVVQVTPKLPLSTNNANNAGNGSLRMLKSSTAAGPNLLICNPFIQVTPKLPPLTKISNKVPEKCGRPPENAYIEVDKRSFVCKICNEPTHQVLSISKCDIDQYRLRQLIRMHLPIERLAESDSLPIMMCKDCVNTLLTFHEMYEKFIATQKKLEGLQANTDRQTGKAKADDSRLNSEPVASKPGVFVTCESCNLSFTTQTLEEHKELCFQVDPSVVTLQSGNTDKIEKIRKKKKRKINVKGLRAVLGLPDVQVDDLVTERLSDEDEKTVDRNLGDAELRCENISTDAEELSEKPLKRKVEVFDNYTIIQGSYVCNECLNEFKSTPLIRKHIESECPKRMNDDNYCEIFFEGIRTKKQISRPRKIQRSRIGRFKYSCDNCKIGYNLLSALRNHMMNTHGLTDAGEEALVQLSKRPEVCIVANMSSQEAGENPDVTSQQL